MKKIFAVSITAAMATVAAGAAAQSSVTIYGITDAAVVRTSNVGGGKLLELRNGGLQSSRFGFRGREELGNSLYATFVLESGYDISTGSPSSATTFFNRQSYVGLGSTSVGTVTAGLQYTPIYDFLVLQSGAVTFGGVGGAVDGIATAGSSAGRFDNTLSGTRFANSIKFTSVPVNGLRGILMAAASEGSAVTGRMLGTAANYEKGPLYGSVSYFESDCPRNTCSVSQAENKVFAVGGAYNFDFMRVNSIFTKQRNAKNVQGADADVFSILGTVPVGALALSAGYQLLNDRTVANQDIRQLNLGASYFLSKRSTVYVTNTIQRVDNNGRASMGVVNSSNGRQNQVSVGMRHIF